MLSPTQRALLEGNFVKYAQDKCAEITLPKLALLRLTAAIVIQSIEDLYDGDIVATDSAIEYFKSFGYAYDCSILQVDVATMDRAVKSFLNLTVRDYDDSRE